MKDVQLCNIFKPMILAFSQHHFESKIFSSTSFQLVRLWFGWDLIHSLAFTAKEKMKQTQINIFNITWLKAHCSHQLVKCRQICIWILMVHCCKLIGIDQKECRFHLQCLSGSRYCNTRKMPWSLLHSLSPSVILCCGGCSSAMLLSSW